MEIDGYVLEWFMKDAEVRGKMIQTMKNLNKNQDELKADINDINERITNIEGCVREIKARQKILWTILSIILSVILGVWIYNYFNL